MNGGLSVKGTLVLHVDQRRRRDVLKGVSQVEGVEWVQPFKPQSMCDGIALLSAAEPNGLERIVGQISQKWHNGLRLAHRRTLMFHVDWEGDGKIPSDAAGGTFLVRVQPGELIGVSDEFMANEHVAQVIAPFRQFDLLVHVYGRNPKELDEFVRLVNRWPHVTSAHLLHHDGARFGS